MDKDMDIGQPNDTDGQPNDTTTHHVDLVGVMINGRKQFIGVCTCGVRSGLMLTAGMVWGWEAQHRGME